MFGIEADALIVNLPFKLKATFDKLNGKFSALFSNSAIVDCHYVFPSFIKGVEKSLKEIRLTHPLKYAEAIALLEALKLYLKDTGSTFCDFAMDLSGILTDQSTYYLGSYGQIEDGLAQPTAEIQEALTLATNMTLSYPIGRQIKQSS